MTSPKKRVNPLFVALAVVLVAVVVAVGVVFFQLHSKISALQTGASFTFRYEIAPNSPDKPPLLNILERVNASSGSVSGQYAPGKLQLCGRCRRVNRRNKHIFDCDRRFGVDGFVKCILTGLGAFVKRDRDALNQSCHTARSPPSAGGEAPAGPAQTS